MPAGRPLKFKDPAELEEAAEEYFTQRVAENKPITITGLAYHLDTTRQTLCDYEGKDEFTDTVKRMKLRCEMYAEEQLYEGKATGPIFALKNFGWKDSQDINHGGQPDNPIITTSDQAILDQYLKGKP
jgi:hypothetical protein